MTALMVSILSNQNTWMNASIVSMVIIPNMGVEHAAMPAEEVCFVQVCAW